MPPPLHILFVFLDGVGLGHAASTNPLATLALPAFEALAGGQPWTATAHAVDAPTHVFRPIDANLGVEGLPQSGTGQATLFTGVNCAQVAGRHFGPFPHSQTKPVIASDNLFRQVLALEGTHTDPAAFANAYPPQFFDFARRNDRWTVTTLCCLAAGLAIRSTAEIRAGRGLTADLTGRAWRQQLAIDIPEITEAEAGRRLAALHRRHRLTLFEYYLTDKAGHGRLEDPAGILEALDRFFSGLLEALDAAESLLVVTSDHGNLEDLSTKTHTRNPVPLVAFGRGASYLREVRDLTGVTPTLVEALRTA